MNERPEIETPDYYTVPLKEAFDAGLESMLPYVKQLEAQIKDGQDAIDNIRDAPRAVSAEADFHAMTWTFHILPSCRTGGGTYALVWVPNVELRGDALLRRPS